ncbi:MAG: hypothetical protein ACF8R7_03570 [Phycisphaerales bacterium JB039]
MDDARERAALIAWLAEHDERCPVCNYNVRGVRQATCPECAAPLRLGVVSPHVALGPWLLAIIAFALALGFDGVVTTLLTIGMGLATLYGSGPPLLAAVGLLGSFLLLGALSGAGLWWMLARRRQWRQAAPRVQWARAWAIFAAVFVIHASAGALMAWRL